MTHGNRPADRMTRQNRWIRGGTRRPADTTGWSMAGIHAGDDSGTSLVETALTLPLLLTVLMGITQCGFLVNNWVTLTDAARAGARQLSIARLPGQNACDLATATTKAAAPSLTATKLTVTFAVTDSCTSLVTGSMVTLTATYPCDLSILGVNYAPSCTLRAQTTERVE
jgi:Flp pilus assembly protein TadG